MPYLPNIHSPQDIKHLNFAELKALCQEIREYIDDVIPGIGGHYASSLGSVEITVALHYVFNSPRDKMIWDVGHQGYVHKILTGRREALKKIRRLGGISGFLRRSESEHDIFGAGHASTSISSALGIAVARDLNQDDFKVVAVIGDGGMTGGLAYEALNNAGSLKKDLIVILNDNRMSISPNVGAISHYLANIIANPFYNKIKSEIWKMTGLLPASDTVRLFARKMEENFKNLLVPGMLFEDLGFKYIGPIDGHDVEALINILNNVKEYRGPYLIHALTSKGKGFQHAEQDPVKYHGVKAPAPKKTLEGPRTPSYSEIFGSTMLELAEINPKVCIITAAMTEGTGLVAYRDQYPERFFDVGIAEGHAVTFSAGLATQNLRPVVAIYSTFLQRALDHIVHDVALQRLPVVFALDRGGFAGEDGPTHHGALDLSYLCCIQDMIVAAPKDGNELRNLLYTGVMQDKNPFAIRYPKDPAITSLNSAPMQALPIGVWEELVHGDDLALLAVGSMVQPVLHIIDDLTREGISVEVLNCRFVKPFDVAMLTWVANKFKVIITLEENVLHGGFGSNIARTFNEESWTNCRLNHIGLPDKFITHGSRKQLLDLVELTPEKLLPRILNIYQKQRMKKVFSFFSS